MKYTKEQFATLLNGREYGDEIERNEQKDAKESGLVVVHGYSDDCMEFEGAIDAEVGCYGGGDVFVYRGGVIDGDHDCDCDFCGFKDKKSKCATIEAVWNREGYSWLYSTTIPHATFEIMEDSEKYCRGIVFNLSDLPSL